MRKANNKLIGGIILIAIVLVAIGYAVITNVELNINGTAKSKADQDNFIVELIGEPQTSGDGTTTATIDANDKTQGTMEVSGLSAKGETAVATYIVKNKSQDLSADLTAEATSTNEEYFEVQCSLEKTTLKAEEETTMTVKVKLLKTPIDETKENLSATIGVNIEAEPKQPGEETNGDATTVISGKTTAGTYLPKGFTQVKGTTLENGLTIEDSTGNQYVWVEVPKTTEVYKTAGLEIKEFTDEEYTAIETDLNTYTNAYRQNDCVDEYSSDTATGLTSEQYYMLKKKMLKSVYKNGGFYVGKYETGIEDKPRISASELIEIPVIKQNAYPYNYVTCNQAQTLAIDMESGNYTSSLMFGVQWKLILKYLETKGTDQVDLKVDSTNWGNYSNNLWNIANTDSKYAPNGSGWTSGAYGAKGSTSSILLSTGASNIFSKQGIYDLSGNVREWTLEYTSSTVKPCAYRGGGCDASGANFSAFGFYEANTNDCYSTIGFRIVIF